MKREGRGAHDFEGSAPPFPFIKDSDLNNIKCKSIPVKLSTERYGLVWFGFMVFNATFNNISVILLRKPEDPE
jgi:hypothetical protein